MIQNRQAAGGAQQSDVVAHHGEQALLRREDPVAGDSLHGLEKATAEPFDHRDQEGRFPRVVTIDRRLGETDALGETLHGQLASPTPPPAPPPGRGSRPGAGWAPWLPS